MKAETTGRMTSKVTEQLSAETALSGAQVAGLDSSTIDMGEQPTLDLTEKPAAGPAEESAPSVTGQLSSGVPYDIAWDQIQGRRKTQQDCAVCIPMGVAQHLLVLADGMGGHAAGDLASSVAVTSFCGAFEAPGMPDDPNERLMVALEAANYAIYDQVAAAPELAGMGTTLVAAVVDGRELRWASVGDSPLWLIRDGAIRRLNADHSVSQDIADRVAAGEMTAAEAAAMLPGGSMLLSALDGVEIELVDVPEVSEKLEPNDILILASDGVETCGLDELTGIAGDCGFSAGDIVARILAQVEAHRSVYQDNATVIVCRVPPSDSSAASQ